MNVVDFSGWLAFFADGANADVFASPIENVPELIVPSISMYEVFKRVLQQRGEDYFHPADLFCAHRLVWCSGMGVTVNPDCSATLLSLGY